MKFQYRFYFHHHQQLLKDDFPFQVSLLLCYDLRPGADPSRSSVQRDIPAHPISFEHNSELSALSWEAVDNRLSLEELTEKYREIVSAPMIHPLFVLLLVGFANASFCKLFGGDLISMGIVFSATITGFYLKQQMQKKKIRVEIKKSIRT